jgi:GWxTD domain-containing protein
MSLDVSLRRLTSAAALALAVAPCVARAQEVTPVTLASAAGGRGAAWRADSIAAFGDSARALAILDSAIRVDRRDHAAWHRRGMILWAMARSKREGGFIRDGKVIKQLVGADTSLRLAVEYAPDSAQYAVAMGRFALNSNVATMRFGAMRWFQKALDAAERAGDPWKIAEAADEVGMVYWRRYETFARRRLLSGGATGVNSEALDTIAGSALSPQQMRDWSAQTTHEVKGENWMGRADYERSHELFQKALASFPDHPKARRHYYMLLADRERWEELANIAGKRVQQAKWDSPSLLAYGLALHRIGRGMEAQTAFDSALALLGDRERARLTSLARILRTASRGKGKSSDSMAYANGSLPEQLLTDSLYWQLQDPMTLTPENEHRIEFLARVAYAELRWTSDDLDYKGADTDRGEAWIRYGPPKERYGLAGDGQFGSNTEVWEYANGLALVFKTPPAWGTARYGESSYSRVQELKATQPVSWANVPIDRRIDSVEVQIARFRTLGEAGPTGVAGDSADVVMVAELPIDSLLAGLDVARAAVDFGMGVWTGPSVVLLRDSTRVIIDPKDPVNAPRLRAWRERLPAGDHVYRVEALQPDGLRGARALGSVKLRRETGFGTSDLLVAERVAPREDVAARRWRDLIVSPNAAVFRRGEPIGLVWETYGLQPSAEGSARYRVLVSVERKFESRTSAFVANVLSGVGGATGLSAKENNKGRAALRFERTAPSGDVALDWLTLDVGNAAPGRYLVTVEVTDLVSNKATTLSRMVRIR